MIAALTKAGAPPSSVIMHPDGRIEYLTALDSSARSATGGDLDWDAAVGL
jgi:hypothetical protein